METQVLDELKKTLTETLSAAQKPIDDRFKAVEDGIKSTSERLSKIESLPMTRMSLPAIHTPEVYLGHKMSIQGEELRERVKRCKYPLRMLRKSDGGINEEGLDRFNKHILDLAIGSIPANLCHRSFEAQMHLKADNLVEGTDSLGGYLIAPEYLWDIVQLAREKTWALNACTPINMGSDKIYLPAELTLVATYWVDEAGTITATNPTFAQVELDSKKLCGLTSGISVELLEDQQLDIVSMLTEMFGYAIALEIDNQVLNGTGDPVSGVLTAAAGYSVVMGTGSTSFSAVTCDNLRKMIRELSSVDSDNGTFVYSKDIQYYIDTLKDSQGRYIYREPSGDRPAALWSRPVIEASNAPLESDSGASTAFVAFGDWKKFFIGRRIAPTALVADPYTNFATALIRYRLLSRWAFAIARKSAFCRLLTAASE